MKGPFADGGDAVRDKDGCQGGAAGEGIIADGGDAFGDIGFL